MATDKLFLPGAYQVPGLTLRDMEPEEHDRLLERWLETSMTEDHADRIAGRTFPGLEEDDDAA